MTNRQRMLAVLEHKSPDRIPWIPRMKLWYDAQVATGALPARFKGMGLHEVERALRLGDAARDGSVFRIEYDGVDVVTTPGRLDNIIEYRTPKGNVRFVQSRTPYEADMGQEGRITKEHPLKTQKDYDVWAYVVEHSKYVPTYDAFIKYDREVGDEGLPMVGAGDCPFHYWAKELVGYQDSYLHLVDFPERVEALLDIMTEKEAEMWQVIAKSPAKLILHGTHLSSQMTPPRYFKKYITPYYRRYAPVLHKAGKSLAMHGDNDTSAILMDLKDAGYDMIECFVTSPMAKVTLKQAREAWGTSVIIYGGVPSIILEKHFPEAEFEKYMMELFRTIAPGDAFILGIADNAMPTSMLSRIERITELVDRYGTYPIRV